jgi:DNA-binding transcriptional LysR family regulator
MARDIDIALLRAFVAVVDTGSVTGAARLLNRTQAAVSQQLKRLEDQFGCELFLREHKKMILGPAGERLLGAAQKIVALNDETWGAMTTPDFKGEVVLGVPTDIVPTYIPPILRRFATQWPHVRVTLRTGNSFHLVERFDAGEVHVALSTDLESDGRPELLRLDHLVWVGAPGGKAHTQDPLPIAVGDQSCRFRPIALDTLRAAGRTWRLALEVSSQIAQDAAVSADIAVAPALRDSVAEALVVLGPECRLPELPEFQINLYTPPVGVNELADELARHIRAEFFRRFGPPPERVHARAKPRRRRELAVSNDA